MMTRQTTTPGARRNGFSLPELLVVIAIMGLFILFGGPALADAFRAYKVRSAADVIATDLRAMRYLAVAMRTTRTVTVHTQSDATTPNTYSFVNRIGDTVVRRVESGVNIETASNATIPFGITGSTGVSGPLSVLVSMDVNSDRGDRYTVTVSPTGTVSTAYASYVP
jgi:type IV fimbrial biogenesis protein FimT/type IV fimbrial biogenesis protein FimU